MLPYNSNKIRYFISAVSLSYCRNFVQTVYMYASKTNLKVLFSNKNNPILYFIAFFFIVVLNTRYKFNRVNIYTVSIYTKCKYVFEK